MKTLKYTIALFLLFFVLSCSKDEENLITAIPETKILLAKSSDSDDGLTSVYTYNNIGKLINIKRHNTANPTPIEFNFSYNTNGTLKQMTNGNEITQYYYNNEAKIIRKESRNGLDVYKYTYETNQITENYRFTTTNNGWRQVYKYNANVIELKVYNDANDANPLGTLGSTIIYSYDNKKNPYTTIPFEYYFPDNSINNKTSEQNNSGNINQTTYEYNTDNYPTKKILPSYTRTFEYKKI